MPEMSRRSRLVYGLLFLLWAVFLGWQAAEHNRVRQSTRVAVVNRAKDISNTLGLVMRSQRRFGGVISKERLESSLKELVKPGEVNAILLLNAAGDMVASAGAASDIQPRIVARRGEHWDLQTVTVMNLVDLGTNVTQDLETTRPTIVVPRHDLTNRPPSMRNEARTNLVDGTNSPPRERDRMRGPPDGRPGFGRPFWMSEEEYKSLIQKQGVHSFVLVMSTQPLHAIFRQDLWLRTIIGILATISVMGCGLAWRNLAKTSELQLRLVRASELNSHLKEMNLAAAGLAHETRNPLNIVRGLAQMISRQKDASTEIRQQSRDIIDETDRVTAQLNEFINYSRPREVRRSVLSLNSVVGEVVRTLSYDIEEKGIELETLGESLSIEADEQLLRQALFNLVLNAVQAVKPKGKIQVVARKDNASEGSLEVRDNGPGVAPEHRSEIFKPYFTTNQKGTGLGLAVVQQIVLAHGWEIENLANQPSGAIFRIVHLKLSGAS